MEIGGICHRFQDCLNSFQGRVAVNEAESSIYPKQGIIRGEIIIQQQRRKRPVPAKELSVHLHSRSELDPDTGNGKLSKKAHLEQGKTNKRDGMRTTTYGVELHVDPDFGIPGAFIIKNQHKHKFFLLSLTLHVPHNQAVHFECNSWIYPTYLTKTDRIFFSNTCYLPGQTPSGLVKLRKEELHELRGDGTGERKEWERIYEYDYYNDLGNPDKGLQHARQKLGGSELYPYPRRLRTGRPRCTSDNQSESRLGTINLDIYVPPDERLSPKKMSEFMSNVIQAAVHFVLPNAKSLLGKHSIHFESLDEIKSLFNKDKNRTIEGWVMNKMKNILPDDVFKIIKTASQGKQAKYPLPQVIAENEFAWKNDEEFGHQMLAGINPTLIHCLRNFPPESKNGVQSSVKESDIEHNLDGLTLIEAMKQWRIYLLDHHDYLLPFLDRINRKDVYAYASRTILFLRNDATLKPLAIELTLPASSNPTGENTSRVFFPATQGTEAALWQLAKAHVAANDSGYHQLFNHWLKTHAVIEPFIIATRRQLSVMHPIHRLLNPHFKDTMHINALFRSILINSGGILEKTLYTGEVSMELSSALYKDWRFDEESFPANLLKRRMALKDSFTPSGIRLLFEDYPYGADNLDIWVAIKTWVKDYCSFFYTDDNSVISDYEIQQWWREIREVGHGDKSNKKWWCSMTTISDLTETLATLIWIASAYHASVNFGQYAYAGYPPNRPTKCTKFIPEEGTPEFAEFLENPDKFYLNMLPGKFEMTLGLALVDVLSRHTSDELYLGQHPSPEWTDDERVHKRFNKFGDDLLEAEKRILERNRDPKLKNRWGPAKVPHNLLYHDRSNVGYKGRVTGKGITSSISI